VNNVSCYELKQVHRIQSESFDGAAVAEIQRRFDEFLEQDEILCKLISKLKRLSIEAVVFGGWVRDQYSSIVNGDAVKSKDIDIVVRIPKGKKLEEILSEYKHDVTIFGGIVIESTTSKIDIWNLEDTWLIKERNLNCCFTTLPTTTVFSINSVVFFPSQIHGQGKIVGAGFESAIANRELAFTSDRIPFPEFQVVRALVYSQKLSLRLNEEVEGFIVDICKSPFVAKKVRDGVLAYCPEIYQSNAIRQFSEILLKNCIVHPDQSLFFSHCWGVFEGGGVRAAALAGAYESAINSGVNFGRVAGTSAGSIVAALVASGADSNYVIKNLMSKDFKEFIRHPLKKDNVFGLDKIPRFFSNVLPGNVGKLVGVLRNSGVYSSEEVQAWVDKVLSEYLNIPIPVKFSDLKLPLYVVASDIAGGKPRVWCKEKTPNESVAFAVRCSCTIPFFFQPVSDGSSVLVDGGMVSNLPSWVFSSEARGNSTRVLCFRLSEDEVSKLDDVFDYIQRLISTIINSGTTIQLQLQNNIYAVDIPTGNIKATDFDVLDEVKKSTLRQSGFDSVAKFIAQERIYVGSRPENMLYRGFDEKLLLLVQYLYESRKDVVILSSNSYWVYFIFPALVFALKRGISISVLIKSVKYDDYPEHEKYRRGLLDSFGVSLIEVDALPFEGFIVDRIGDEAIAVVSSANGVVGQDYKYDEERISVYSRRVNDSSIISALVKQVECDLSVRAASSVIELTSVDSKVIFDKLKNVHQYRNAEFKCEDVPVSGDLLTLDLHVKEYKLLQVAHLFEMYRDFKVAEFSAARFESSLGGSSIVTPPVLERIGNDLIIIEGHTRFYYALRNGISSIKSVIVERVGSPLPAIPRPLSTLNLASDTIIFQNQFDGLNSSCVRNIEQALHPID